MIAEFIVVSSIILAAVFTVVWLVRPGFRRRIEDPKLTFQHQVQAYNQQVTNTQVTQDGHSDGSD